MPVFPINLASITYFLGNHFGVTFNDRRFIHQQYTQKCNSYALQVMIHGKIIVVICFRFASKTHFSRTPVCIMLIAPRRIETTLLRAAPWENRQFSKCEQRKPRPACAFAQAGLGLRCSPYTLFQRSLAKVRLQDLYDGHDCIAVVGISRDRETFPQSASNYLGNKKVK